MTAPSKTEKTRLKRERVTKRRRIRWTVIGMLLAAVGGGGYYAWSVRNAPLEGSPALGFTLAADSGRDISLVDFIGKKPVILLFYMFSN